MGKRSDPGWHAQGYADGGAGDWSSGGTARGGRAGSGVARTIPDAADTSEDAPEEDGRKRRLDLNLPQVAGSAVAAVVAAKFASNLGVYGTILGAGLVSAIATFGGPLFQHFFRRTGERIRVAAVQAKPRGRQVPLPTQADGAPVPATFRAWQANGGAPDAVGSTAALWKVAPDADGRAPHDRDAEAWAPHRPEADGWAPHGTGTDTWDATAVLGTGGPGTMAAGGAPDAPAPHDDLTRLLRRAVAQRDAQRGHGPPPPAVPAPGGPPEGVESPTPYPSRYPAQYGEPSGEYTEGTVHHARVRRLKRPLIAAGMVFAVTMGGITGYELVSGHSIGDGTAGTTIGHVFDGGHHAPRHTPGTPPPTPSEQPSDSGPSGSGPGLHSGEPTPGTDRPQDPGHTPTPGGPDGRATGTGSDGTGTQHQSTDPGTGSGGDDHSTTPPAAPTPTPTQDGGTAPDTGPDGTGTQERDLQPIG